MSINEQTVSLPVKIVIVDDGSPVSALQELSGLDMRENHEVHLLEQDNQGAAAARNTALQWIMSNSDSEIVAFLDSDDWWVPWHLQNIMTAMESGQDFYFSDFRKQNSDISIFQQIGFPGQSHPTIGVKKNLHRFTGDFMDLFSLFDPLQTGAIAVRKSVIGLTRFDTDFWNCGEDQWFFASVLRNARGVAYSTDIECILGKGVNIYAGIQSGSKESIRRDIDEIRLRSRLLDICTRDDQKIPLRARIDEAHSSLMNNLLYRLKSFQRLPYSVLLAHNLKNPLFPIQFGYHVFKLIINKLMRGPH